MFEARNQNLWYICNSRSWKKYRAATINYEKLLIQPFTNFKFSKRLKRYYITTLYVAFELLDFFFIRQYSFLKLRNVFIAIEKTSLFFMQANSCSLKYIDFSVFFFKLFTLWPLHPNIKWDKYAKLYKKSQCPHYFAHNCMVLVYTYLPSFIATACFSWAIWWHSLHCVNFKLWVFMLSFVLFIFP